MNKKFYVMAAFAAVTMAGMTSCSNDDAIETGAMPNSSIQKNGTIGFNITQDDAISTRGTATTPENFLSQISDFQVIGFYSDGSGRYVGSANNVGTVIDGDGAGAWDYHTATQVQYWPTGNLDFQAITPSADASFTLANTVDESTPGEIYPRLVANVTVPSAVANQKDIMFASATAQNHAADGLPVDLTFTHALSQVVFSGKVASTNITAIVNEIEICNIHDMGRVGYLAALTTLSAAATGTATASFQPGLKTDVADRTMTTTDAKDLTATDGALMMIPQEQTAWTHTTPEKAIANATGSYLRISCKVQDNTSSTWLIGAASGVGEFEDVYIPFDLATANSKNWELGKRYTYTLVFGNGTGGYDENGDPLTNMVPITYTVTTANSWTPAPGVEVAF